MEKLRVGIIGSTGYVGAELIRILNNHPYAYVSSIGSNSFIDEEIKKVYTNMGNDCILKCVQNNEVIDNCDFLFTALPHGVSEEFVIKAIEKGIKVVDLGADFRIKNEVIFKEWYGVDFINKELHKEAVYGLCEIYREEIKEGKIIANPGCYVTSISLPLMPLLKNKLIKSQGIIADAKSGVTGAGRGLSLMTHYTEINENMVPYKIANHRHTPEIEQNLSDMAKEDIKIIFTPTLIPINRGIISNIYCDKEEGVTLQDVYDKLIEFYENDKFIDILPIGEMATIKHVRLSNTCAISLHECGNKIIICSAIDNMVKGSAGQAIQNMNLMCGFEEEAGLNYMAPAF